MSEYQHYEFHAIDRPLNPEVMAAVGKMSSRVQLSSRKAVFTYSYSDFRYDEEEVLVDYFDFMLYISNWGTKRMMMKFPLELVDYDFLKKYRIRVLSDYEQEIRVLRRGEYIIVDINYSEEDGLGWIDEGDHGYDFLNIRQEIMEGDYRSLFMMWLRFLEDLYRSNEFDHEYSIDSKLIPSNLLSLSASSHAVKDFYGIDEDWLAVMRAYSGFEEVEKDNYEAIIPNMSKERMIEYIQMILREESHLKIRLIKELQGKSRVRNSGSDLIKLLEIGKRIVEIKEKKLREEEKRKARETLERMDKIRQNREGIEKEVTASIEQGNSKGYRLALSKILELKAMNDYFNMGSYFELLLDQIRTNYSRKSSFIRMLKEERLIE
ncbi:MAG: hypothetical protein AAFO07_20590 [Bacteroidota bacterium]